MKTIKSLSFYSTIMLPYILSSLLLFFTFMSKDTYIAKETDTVKTMLGLDTNAFNIVMILTLTISNLVIFFVVFYILKLFIFLFDRAKVTHNKHLFFSLLIGYTVANLCALIINDFLNLSIESVGKYTPFIDLIIFTGLYYYFSKLKKITTILFMIKLLIGLPGVLV